MQPWWAEETSFTNIKILTDHKLLNDRVVYIYTLVVKAKVNWISPNSTTFISDCQSNKRWKHPTAVELNSTTNTSFLLGWQQHTDECLVSV